MFIFSLSVGISRRWFQSIIKQETHLVLADCRTVWYSGTRKPVVYASNLDMIKVRLLANKAEAS